MRPRFLLIVVAVAAAVVALDQLTKAWAIARLAGQPAIEVIGTFLRFTYVENTGAAFGLGTGFTWLFTIIATIVVIVILRTARRLGSYLWAIAFGGLLGGALGNLIDRLIREPGIGQGYVVDFIQLPLWPVFNIADISIVSSAIGMVLLSIAGVDLRGRRVPAQTDE
jgi:signal peptidase II